MPKDKAIYDTDVPSKATGYWRLSRLGERFVRGLINIPRDVFVFNDQVFSVSEEKTSIFEALGTAFDFSQMMDAPAGVMH